MSTECFSRQTLRDMLTRWAEGGLDDQTLAVQSEELWGKYGVWQNWPRDDKRSITFAALNKMRLRDNPALTREDVPFLITFLEAPYGEEHLAWAGWDARFGAPAAASAS